MQRRVSGPSSSIPDFESLGSERGQSARPAGDPNSLRRAACDSSSGNASETIPSLDFGAPRRTPPCPSQTSKAPATLPPSTLNGTAPLRWLLPRRCNSTGPAPSGGGERPVVVPSAETPRHREIRLGKMEVDSGQAWDGGRGAGGRQSSGAGSLNSCGRWWEVLVVAGDGPTAPNSTRNRLPERCWQTSVRPGWDLRQGRGGRSVRWH